MKLYVGTYAKYDEGSLFGAWLDLDDYSNKEEFIEACLELHKDEEEPELMFQDCEGDLSDFFYNESFIDEEYWSCKEAIENSSIDADAICGYLNENSMDMTTDNIDKASDNYYGTWNSEEDFAEDMVDDCGYLNNLPNWISCHIDWEGIVRELSYDYDFIDTENGVAVFSK